MKLQDIKNAYKREVLFAKLDAILCTNLKVSEDEKIRIEKDAVGASCILIAGLGLACLEPVLICPIAIILGSYACIDYEFNNGRKTKQYQIDKEFEERYNEVFENFESNSDVCTIKKMLNDKELGFKNDDFDLNDESLIKLMMRYDKFIYAHRAGIKNISQFIKDKHQIKKELFNAYLKDREREFN